MLFTSVSHRCNSPLAWRVGVRVRVKVRVRVRVRDMGRVQGLG